MELALILIKLASIYFCSLSPSQFQKSVARAVCKVTLIIISANLLPLRVVLSLRPCLKLAGG